MRAFEKAVKAGDKKAALEVWTLRFELSGCHLLVSTVYTVRTPQCTGLFVVVSSRVTLRRAFVQRATCAKFES